jgi:aminopeptidase YwaD
VGPLAEPSLILSPAAARRILLATALLIVLLASVACGDSGGEEATPTPSPSPTEKPPTPSPTPAPTPDPNFSGARALEHLRQLSVVIGSRAAGSDGETRAAEYIRAQLAAYGYTTSIQEFPIQSVTDLGSMVTITAPTARTMEGNALSGSAQGSATGQIVPAGIGRVGEFPANVQGNIALIERGELTFGMKVDNATAAGASGVIIYNNEPGDFNGGLSSGSTIPALSVSQEDGRSLASNATTGTIEVQVSEQTVNSRNVVAKPVDGSCEIVTGGHLDSVPAGPGANDNASGTSVVLEIARARAARGQADGVCYVLFGAEEIGLLGSGHYVRQLPPVELDALEAMLNFDMLAVGDNWPLIGSPSVTDVAVVEAQELGVPYRVSSSLPQNLGSDHANFIQAGVPSMIFNCFCDPNYHTSEDKFEFVSEERLSQAGLMGLGIIETLLAT